MHRHIPAAQSVEMSAYLLQGVSWWVINTDPLQLNNRFILREIRIVAEDYRCRVSAGNVRGYFNMNIAYYSIAYWNSAPSKVSSNMVDLFVSTYSKPLVILTTFSYTLALSKIFQRSFFNQLVPADIVEHETGHERKGGKRRDTLKADDVLNSNRLIGLSLRTNANTTRNR